MTSFYIIFSFSTYNFLLNSIDLIIDVCNLIGSTFGEFADIVFDKSTGNDQRITDLESSWEEFQTSPISMTSFCVIFSLSISNFLSNSIDLVIDVCNLF